MIRRWMPVVLLACLAGCGRSEPASPRPSADNKMLTLYRGQAGEEGAGETTVEVKGWGTLKGQFVYQGTAPVMGTLNAAGVAICENHKIPEESLIVGPDGGIRNIAIYTKNNMSGMIHADYMTDEYKQQQVTFDQDKCLFTSHVLAIDAAHTMVIKNSDMVSHNTNMNPTGDTPSNTLLAPDGSTTYNFRRAQNIPVAVSCNIHAWMKAYVLPRKDPYFAVTNDKGEFTIEKLPAGVPLQFTVWHESGSGSNGILQTISVTLSADGEVKDLGKIELPASQFKVQ